MIQNILIHQFDVWIAQLHGAIVISGSRRKKHDRWVTHKDDIIQATKALDGVERQQIFVGEKNTTTCLFNPRLSMLCLTNEECNRRWWLHKRRKCLIAQRKSAWKARRVAKVTEKALRIGFHYETSWEISFDNEMNWKLVDFEGMLTYNFCLIKWKFDKFKH